MRKHFEPVVGDVQQSREVPLLALVTLLPAVLGHWEALTKFGAQKLLLKGTILLLVFCLGSGSTGQNRQHNCSYQPWFSQFQGVSIGLKELTLSASVSSLLCASR